MQSEVAINWRQQAISYSGSVSTEITFELLKYTLTALIAGESLVISTETVADNHEILGRDCCVSKYSVFHIAWWKIGLHSGIWVTHKFNFLVVKKQFQKKKKMGGGGQQSSKIWDNCYSLKLWEYNWTFNWRVVAMVPFMSRKNPILWLRVERSFCQWVEGKEWCGNCSIAI